MRKIELSVEIFLLLSEGFSINIFVSDQSMMLVHLASELWKNSFAPRFTMRGHLQFLCRFLFTLFLLNKLEWIPGINWLQLTSSLMGSLFASVWSVLFGESVRHLPKRVSSSFFESSSHGVVYPHLCTVAPLEISLTAASCGLAHATT